MNEKINKFLELVRDQFTYGGKKYAVSGADNRESTDVLFDKHGKNWLIGTIDKYTFRYKNLARERDLLKIATYMYILWLKRGFFIKGQGFNIDVVDTNVKIKEFFFDDFIAIVNRRDSKFKKSFQSSMPNITETLGVWSVKSWDAITEDSICDIFLTVFEEWNERYSESLVRDTDTYNEDKK